MSSANTPTKLYKIPSSIHLKNQNSPIKKTIPPPIEKNERPQTEEPIKNFSNYFNSLQNQERINDKRANVKEFKKEVKMIIKDAKQSKHS